MNSLSILLALSIGLSSSRTDSLDVGIRHLQPEFTYMTVDYLRRAWGKSPFPDGYQNDDSRKTLTISGMDRMEKKKDYELDRWGGNPDLEVTEVVSRNSPGFWRTGKVGDRWYFINPDGHATVLHGVNGVIPETERDGRSEETLALYGQCFGGKTDRWARFAGNDVLAEYGFNFFSCNPRRSLLYSQVMTNKAVRSLRSPRRGICNGETELLYLLRTFSWDYGKTHEAGFSNKENNVFELLFDPQYLPYIERLAEEATAQFRGSKHFIGYYIDNELPFNSYKDSDPLKGIELEHFLTLEDHFKNQFAGARKFARDFMLSHGVEPLASNITTELRDLFRYEVARYYYRTTTDAVRKADPDHLILGSRLFNQSMYNRYTVKACAEFCDVISVNYYNYWTPTEEYCREQLGTWTDKPFMVTEFYVKDEHASFGMTPYENVEGAGWIVRDQRSRGWYYQNFCIHLLRMGNCVGWQWFEFMDNFGKRPDGTRWTGSNKGVVSARYEPYRECLELMKEMHLNIYQVIDYFENKNTGK